MYRQRPKTTEAGAPAAVLKRGQDLRSEALATERRPEP